MQKTLLNNGSEQHYNLSPIKYKWAFELYKKSRKNDWEPGEIPIGNDILCYREQLTDGEKECFHKVFATLTTSDLCVQENLAIAIYEAIVAPEARQFIGNQIKEEGVHNITYQYVIEHLGLDEEYIYNLYKTSSEIAQKFDLAKVYATYILDYNRFIRGELQFWPYKSAPIDILLKGLIFYYICFEGGWFSNGFTPIFSLARRGKMLNTADQLQYIFRDETNHYAFGILLIKAIMAENKHNITQEIIQEIFKECVKSEEIYANFAIPDMIGYNAKMHIRQLKFFLDRRAKALGFEKVFETPNQCPWLDELVTIKKEKNFFETRVTEYQVGSLSFGETTSIENISNWVDQYESI